VALVIASVAITFGTMGGGTPLALAGLSMIFGGVAQLLTPTPVTTASRSSEEQRNSFTFDKSNVNTAQGSVVPVLYGERIVGSLPVISFSIELQNSL
jgi:predicted phage tail protein